MSSSSTFSTNNDDEDIEDQVSFATQPYNMTENQQEEKVQQKQHQDRNYHYLHFNDQDMGAIREGWKLPPGQTAEPAAPPAMSTIEPLQSADIKSRNKSRFPLDTTPTSCHGDPSKAVDCDQDEGMLWLTQPNSLESDSESSTSTSSSLSSPVVLSKSPGKGQTPGLSLLERRARNVERNRDILERLGLNHGFLRKASKGSNSGHNKRKKSSPPVEHELRKPARRGMLLASLPPNSTDTVTRESPVTNSYHCLCERFPDREAQIRKIQSLLQTAMESSRVSPGSYIPAPIVVTGSTGAGKTAVVRACVDAARMHQKSLQIFIDCAALDDASIEDVTALAYSQMRQQDWISRRDRIRSSSGPSPEKNNRPVYATDNSNPTPEHVKKSKEYKLFYENVHPQGEVDDMEDRIEHGRSGLRRKRKSKEIATVATPDSSAIQTNVWTLGCAIKRYLTGEVAHCGVMVLDHAERLLSLDAKRLGSKDRINFLSQFLLLPRVLRMNLTIIVISKNILLEHTRLDTPPSVASLQGCIQPIRIHFPAYTSKASLKKILFQSDNQRMIFGHAGQEGFQLRVRQSYIGTIIQSLHGTTFDVREYLTLARSLWPAYIEPLSSSNIDRTVQTATKGLTPEESKQESHLGREVLQLLDKRFFPKLRDIAREPTTCLGTQSNSSLGNDFPRLTKILLLAAYLCQVNRPERDQQLFTIQKNGRRRVRNAHNQQGNADENIAYGVYSADHNKSLRPKSFQAERMLSVYVSLVSLHSDEKSDDEHLVQSLGNQSFFDTLTYLRDIGILHEYPKRGPNDPIRMNDVRYWCSLTHDEARTLSRSVDFPLEKYML